MSSPSSASGPGAASSAGSPRRVALLGSTGSIGRQAIDVLSADPAFRVVALAAATNVEALAEQARRLRPSAVALADEGAARAARDSGLPAGTEVLSGEDALVELATRDDVDMVVVGTGGIVSLRPIVAALDGGKIVATANKETLVAGGHLVMPRARARAAERRAAAPADPLASPLGWLRPIDSEHSAIWQCLAGEDLATVARLILTASGGPFLDLPIEEFASITPERALRHPTWSMGDKITIDSATLANKGLEVIEAHWLYDSPYEAIDVVIHPPDEARFPALRIAREAGPLGPRATAALIAADDVAVARFLYGSLDFQGIPRLLEAAVARFGPSSGPDPDLDELVALDAEVRASLATSPARAGA